MRSVYEEEIHQSVVVVVEDSHAGQHGFYLVLSRGHAVVHLEGDTTAVDQVLKDDWSSRNFRRSTRMGKRRLLGDDTVSDAVQEQTKTSPAPSRDSHRAPPIPQAAMFGRIALSTLVVCVVSTSALARRVAQLSLYA